MRRDGGDVSEAEPNWSELETAMRIRGFGCNAQTYVMQGVGELVDVLCDGNSEERMTQNTDKIFP